ncbi:hypothetical protein Tsubulata_048286, partial [Turnera subulata]
IADAKTPRGRRRRCKVNRRWKRGGELQCDRSHNDLAQSSSDIGKTDYDDSCRTVKRQYQVVREVKLGG